MSILVVALPNATLKSKITKPIYGTPIKQNDRMLMQIKEQLDKPEVMPPGSDDGSQSESGSESLSEYSSEEEQEDLDHSMEYVPNNYEASLLSSIPKGYRKYLERNGIHKFLDNYMEPKMNRESLVEIIIELGYSNSHQSKNLTAKTAAEVLIEGLIWDNNIPHGVDSDTSINSSPMTKHIESFDPYQQKALPKKKAYSLDLFLKDLSNAKKILVVTGAGILTSLGIPDFRSFKGLYSQLTHLELHDPQQVFDIDTFNKDPSIFYSIAHLVLPPESKYSLLHAFLRLLQDKNKLLRNYTQNIDDLESKAGITDKKLIQCHGSFRTAACITCKTTFVGSKIYEHIRKQRIPRCFNCFDPILDNSTVAPNFGVIKPSITFFGENLPKQYHDSVKADCRDCDLVIVVGTSLKVDPVASLISKIPDDVPKILINKDDIVDRDFDLRLLGNSDDVASYLSKQMGRYWDIPHDEYDYKNGVQMSQNKKNQSVYTVDSKDSKD